VKEPRRLRDESKSPIERLLLETAASYRRPPSTRAKTLGALGLASSAALSAGAARSAWAMVAKLGSAKALAAVAALGAAIAVPAAYYGSRSRSAPTLPSSVESRQAPVSKAPALASAAPLVVAPEPPAPTRQVPARSAVERPKQEGRSRAKTPSRARPLQKELQPVATEVLPSRRAADLSAEVAAIEAARSRLANGDAATALALLDQYTGAFPQRRLEPEAMVLRVEALAKMGRVGEAKKVAETFLQQYPKSVLAARVREHLGN
jgi:hypothetical protein